jgi:hypothetical protein
VYLIYSFKYIYACCYGGGYEKSCFGGGFVFC